ncbi:MAG: ABC transporter substrate-binding protein, partial [Fibrobacter sp.]|nr:ABC transporter substrate-binding protein [Fibrobacter sp.]
LNAIKTMAHNIVSGKHPAEMVKMAESENKNGTAIYILPLFFAKKIKSDTVKIIWPKDGAIASPVFMLIKKNVTEKYRKILDFILSSEMGEMFLKRFFQSVHPQSDNSLFPDSIKWLGWDFLNENDIGGLKTLIRSEFMKIWKP